MISIDTLFRALKDAMKTAFERFLQPYKSYQWCSYPAAPILMTIMLRSVNFISRARSPRCMTKHIIYELYIGSKVVLSDYQRR